MNSPKFTQTAGLTRRRRSWAWFSDFRKGSNRVVFFLKPFHFDMITDPKAAAQMDRWVHRPPSFSTANNTQYSHSTMAKPGNQHRDTEGRLQTFSVCILFSSAHAHVCSPMQSYLGCRFRKPPPHSRYTAVSSPQRTTQPHTTSLPILSLTLSSGHRSSVF